MRSIVRELPILSVYDKQRFTQFNPCDSANFTYQESKLGKKGAALYPILGRRHINFLGINRLIFSDEPRFLFKTNNYWYAVVVNSVVRIDRFYNQVEIGNLTTFNGNVFAAFLVVSQLPQQPSITFVGFVDGQNIYIYREETGAFVTITDTNAPANPTYIAAFGNRFVAAGGNTSQFNLSQINLGGNAFNPATAWTVAGNPLFAQETNIIRQLAVLKNVLYIFTPYTTGVWSNNPSTIETVSGPVEFPWKKNTSYSFDFGLVDPNCLDVGFGRMTWVGENEDGLKQILSSNGNQPVPISTEAISVLFQKLTTTGNLSPFLTTPLFGFMYSYENNIFYRLSCGHYDPTGLIKAEDVGNSIQYNFNTQTWTRCVERNGQRNRIQRHIFFNNVHLVTVQDDTTIYQMSGHFYNNEVSNPDREDPQADNAYLVEPFRYELVTKNIFEPDYDEFITEYVEIDFVWGLDTFIKRDGPYDNTVFIIDEEAGADSEPQFLITDENNPAGPTYIIAEEGNQPGPNESIYFNWNKPHIELYYSDDGGISFSPADVLEFSQLGVYIWRMRWYQLGPSRNRVYKLICYSPAPIVVLGGDMVTRKMIDGTP